MSFKFSTPKKRRRASISQQLEAMGMSPVNISTRDAIVGEGSEDDTDNPVEEEIGNRGKPTYLSSIKNVLSIFLIVFEHLISSIILVLPKSIITSCTIVCKYIFSFFKSNNEIYNEYLKDNEEGEIFSKIEKLKNAKSFEQICGLHGFQSETHLVRTEDGFQLSVHRINPEANGFQSNGKSVFFQHGLLMTSDVWCVMLETNNNLPFRLCQLGFDVFLGNNRGNKYSGKHERYSTWQKEFWNFSIDEFAIHDIPSSINYILKFNNIEKITYIGFSQGCSQILSSVSINEDLNDKIDKLILIAPATTPKKLSNWLINSIVNFEPSLIYTLFGRKILMKSVMFWRGITYPPMFIKLIDIPNKLLFDWDSINIDIVQKLVSYYHLYSTTSVKCVVHWFQIIKSKKFQMYQEERFFNPFEYPTKNIKIGKICLIYGMSDSLVDIDIIVDQLPTFEYIKFNQISNGILIKNSQLEGQEMIKENYKVNGLSNNQQLTIFGVENYEHLDLLWGKSQEQNVIKNVINFLG